MIVPLWDTSRHFSERIDPWKATDKEHQLKLTYLDPRRLGILSRVRSSTRGTLFCTFSTWAFVLIASGEFVKRTDKLGNLFTTAFAYTCQPLRKEFSWKKSWKVTLSCSHTTEPIHPTSQLSSPQKLFGSDPEALALGEFEGDILCIHLLGWSME
jgi:hypothetical protein